MSKTDDDSFIPKGSSHQYYRDATKHAKEMEEVKKRARKPRNLDGTPIAEPVKLENYVPALQRLKSKEKK